MVFRLGVEGNSSVVVGELYQRRVVGGFESLMEMKQYGVAGLVLVKRQPQGEQFAAPEVLKPRPKNMKKKARDHGSSETDKSNVVMDPPSKDVDTQNGMLTGV
ncbi:hypothetical protein SUGI_1119050 [Cryptomeria japonica]|nr:hypothetical protein SUGI_1119050 [Cryptomeria japonica]